MPLMLGPTGKLMLYKGKLFIDTNGTKCCCECVCDCDDLQAKWEALDTLNISISVPPGGCETSISDTMLATAAPEGWCVAWETAPISVPEQPADLLFRLVCNGTTVELQVEWTDPANCNLDSPAVVSVVCDPAFSATFTLGIIQGDAVPPACPCVGDTMTVTITA